MQDANGHWARWCGADSLEVLLPDAARLLEVARRGEAVSDTLRELCIELDGAPRRLRLHLLPTDGDVVAVLGEDGGPAERSPRDAALLALLQHDVRGPLLSVSMVARLLRSQAEQGDLGQLLHEATTRLTRLTRDIVDFVGVRLGETPTHAPRPLDVRAVLAEVVAELIEPNRFEVDEGAAVEGHFDRARLVQIAQNVLAAALRLVGSEQTIRVVVDRDGHEGMVAVALPGHQLDDARLESLFLGADEPDRAVGITLYLARALTQAGGGTLHVERDEHGCRLVVRLPAAPSQTRDDEARDHEAP